MKAAHHDRLSVLIVDDSPILRERLRALVQERKGLAVVGEAGSVPEAWAAFERHQPQAVVLDVKLGQGSGLDLLRRIKRTAHGCVVLVLTNYSDAEFQQACRRQGADFFLDKAADFERAAEVLDRLAGQSPVPAASVSARTQAHGVSPAPGSRTPAGPDKTTTLQTTQPAML